MLTDPALRSQVDALWDRLYAGGLANPLDAVEQLSFLLFLKRLDENEQDRERAARRREVPHQSVFPDETLRWSYWSQLGAAEALAHVRDKVFPFLKTLGGAGGSFAEQMKDAQFKIQRPALLIEACRQIEAMHISQQNQDVQGDLYEYLLSRLNTAGHNGQFRTPRHIIRMMVKMVDPRPMERICDPAAGTCGFPVNAYQHVLETHTSPDVLQYDDDGFPHFLTGDQLTDGQRAFLQDDALRAFDSDSGMTMLRIGSMNLMLHGVERPNFRCVDTLSRGYDEERRYEVILANPPFKGAIDASDVNPTLPVRCKKTEILFLHLFLRLLDNGGRAAVIVPDGVLFGSSGAHVEIRRKLVEDHRLDGVVSMPAGVFRPYAGVSTAVLLFTKGGATDRVWFYDMEHDGFSLDDKRQKVPESDLPDLLACWRRRRDPEFQRQRDARLATLRGGIAPLKADRMKHHAVIHRLRFEEVIADEAGADAARAAREKAEAELAALQAEIAPYEREINQLGRQFWVDKARLAANRYDLSASRYRQIEQEETYYEQPAVTLERMRQLDAAAMRDEETLAAMLAEA